MLRIAYVVFALFVLSLLGPPPSALAADKKTVIQQTNRTYYNLKARGMIEFACEIQPDWDTTFTALKTDTTGRELILPIAKQMKFRVSVGPSGAASVSHQFGQAPPTEDVAQRLRQVSEGVDQMIGGFFETWSQLMINPPLPGDEGDYQMEETSDGYRFTADAAKIHAVIVVEPNFIIKETEASTPDFEGTVHPRFVPHESGLVLDSYEGSFKQTGGTEQHLSVKVQYQDVDAITLPLNVSMSMKLPQGEFSFPMTFAHCQVKKK
jgi:hypothetical protein